MKSGRASRGQPLLLLGAVVIGWIGMRAAIWESPFTSPTSLAGFADFAPDRGAAAIDNKLSVGAKDSSAPAGTAATKQTGSRLPAASGSGSPGRNAETPDYWQGNLPPPSVPLPPVQRPVEPRVAGGHNLLMVAGFSQVRLPSELSAMLLAATGRPSEAVSPAITQSPFDEQSRREDRWSVDAWLLLRPGDTSPVAAGRGSYGRSQAGAVARFKLAPQSDHRPLAYLRTSIALDGPTEGETALGLAARPLAKLPVSVAGEVRVSRFGNTYDVRPSAFAVTELPPVDLPLNLRGEAYAQAGYVGGDFETAFADGQARLDRRLSQIGDAELRAGAGMWGGAQKGAARLDVGPSANLSFRIGETNARVSADWRFRVAGDAAPNSGPAVSLTAGF